MNKKLDRFEKLLLTLIFTTFILGQLLRLQLTPLIATNATELLVVFFNLIHLTRFRTRLHLPHPFHYWLLSFTLITLVLNLFNFVFLGSTVISSSLHLLRWSNFALFFITYFDFLSRFRSWRSRTWIWSIITIFTLVGILQYLLLPDTRFLFLSGWDDHLNRLIGTQFDPAFTGLILIIGWLLWATSSLSNPYLPTLFLTALGLTYSRASFLTFAFIATCHLFFTRSPKSLFSLIFFIFVVILLPRSQGEGVKLERTYSISSRLTSNQQAWEYFLDRPITGYGFNNYAAVSEPNQIRTRPDHANSPDNSLLLLLVTTGVIGTAAYLYWFSKAIHFSYRHSPLLLYTSLALLIHSFTNNSLFQPYLQLLFWIIFATELALIRKKSPQTTR